MSNKRVSGHPKEDMWEQSMVEWGKHRYRKMKEVYKDNNYLSEQPSYKRLGRAIHEDVENAIARYFEDCSKPDAPVPLWLPFVWDLEPSVIAYLGIKKLFDLLIDEPNITAASFEMAKAIEDEVRVRYFKKHMNKSDWMLLERDRKDAKSRYRFMSHFWAKERKYHKQGRYKRFDLFKQHHKAVIGCWLLEVIRLQTNLFSVRDRFCQGRKTKKILVPNPKMYEWIKKYDEHCEVLSPFWLATLEKPIEWNDNWGGGYSSIELPQLPIMKRSDMSRDLSKAFEPLNNLQNVPYRLNKKLYEVMQWAWENDLSIGAMQKSQLLEPLDPVEGLVQKDPEAFIEWKKKAKYIYEFNQRTNGQRMRCLKILHVCKLYADKEKLFFPVQMDYRGRVYYVPSYVNPQSCDLGRSCLEFYNSVAITNEEESRWLLIHGANVWGTKGTYDERIAWVKDHENEIKECASDPFNNDYWQEASDPWAFLAFCFEYQAFKEEGYGFETRLPCHMDATCNGVQILSLLLKDEEIGEWTNLVPQDKPKDLYQEICDRVNTRLHTNKHRHSLAGDWLKWGITRKYVKKIVMCKPFGMNSYSSVDEVEDVFKREIRNGRVNPFSNTEYVEAMLYLATLINDVANWMLGKHITFMKKLKNQIRKCDKKFTWTSPFGLPIEQELVKKDNLYVKSVLNMQSIQVKYRRDNDLICPSQMAKAIVPNVIHSIDASVVHFLACKFKGDVSSIHDSFATQSPNAPKMHQQLREIYQEIFSNDIGNKFNNEVATQTGTNELEDSTELGTLDVSALNDCQYLFS